MECVLTNVRTYIKVFYKLFQVIADEDIPRCKGAMPGESNLIPAMGQALKFQSLFYPEESKFP